MRVRQKNGRKNYTKLEDSLPGLEFSWEEQIFKKKGITLKRRKKIKKLAIKTSVVIMNNH